MMKIITILTAILFNCVTGVALGGFVGIDPVIGALGMNGVSAVVSLLPAETGIMKVGIFRELVGRYVAEFLVLSTAVGLID